MKPNILAAYLSRKDGGKSESKNGDNRTNVSTLADLIYRESKLHYGHVSHGATVLNLWKLGSRRAAKKLGLGKRKSKVKAKKSKSKKRK